MSQKDNLPSSICILRLSSIGDITHMIPVIKTIQHNSPKSDITWIIGKTEYPLVKSMKEVHFIIIDKSENLKSIINLKNEIKGKEFDVLLHMQKSLRSKILSLFITAKKKLGYKDIKMPEESHVLDTFFYNPLLKTLLQQTFSFSLCERDRIFLHHFHLCNHWF